MNQGQALEVHAEKAGNQVQRQEHRSHGGEGAHGFVGPVALGVEMHLQRSFNILFAAPHVAHHAFNMFQHVAPAYLKQIALTLRLRRGHHGPGLQ